MPDMAIPLTQANYKIKRNKTKYRTMAQTFRKINTIINRLRIGHIRLTRMDIFWTIKRQ